MQGRTFINYQQFVKLMPAKLINRHALPYAWNKEMQEETSSPIRTEGKGFCIELFLPMYQSYIL